jgi:hypothetical protein
MSTKNVNIKTKVGKKTSAPRSGTSIIRSPNFQKTYGTRVLVTRTEYDFRAVLANEKLVSDRGEEVFIGESLVILTPLAAKELNKQLNVLIEDWEKENGTIKKRPSASIYSEQSLSP